MDIPLSIDVSSLDHAHRQAMEDVIGRQLDANQRLIIQIATVAPPPSDAARSVIELLTHFYDGMTEEEVDEIDDIIKTRMIFSRQFP